jgi:peroxiredoxin
MSFVTDLVYELSSMWRYRKKEMDRIRSLEGNVPKVGEMAPDFTLRDVTGQESVTLSQFRGKKPVALVFGSFT